MSTAMFWDVAILGFGFLFGLWCVLYSVERQLNRIADALSWNDLKRIADALEREP